VSAVAEVNIAKHRNGDTKTVKLRYRRECGRFESQTPRGIEGCLGRPEDRLAGIRSTPEVILSAPAKCGGLDIDQLSAPSETLRNGPGTSVNHPKGVS
jgi:hypothetical protein